MDNREQYIVRRGDHAITDQATMDSLLRSAQVGRVGVVAEGDPYIVPMNFAYEPGRIIVHGADQGRLFRAIQSNPRVCFEVDEYIATLQDSVLCHYDTAYASVICFGTARVLEGLEDRTEALRSLARKYASEDEAEKLKLGTVEDYRGKLGAQTAVIEISIEVMTGKHQPLIRAA
ncbi:MAG TPA: pyridoxamine 5'-phosphate oxidase family protein [Anaerolineales bacterium]|jgi:hypothetical protein|nr:pyridoxamine 5'-phosphate oxidase family protein [Anaerolineales bacterium]